jgi:AcrR family transcriptional regulator
LLQAAEALLAAGGPDALSIRQVSAAAATSTRAVYALFGSKEGLRSALYQRNFADLRRRLLALPATDDPAADLIRSGIDGFRSQALAHPNLFRLAFEWPMRRIKASAADNREAAAAFAMLLERVARAAGGRLPPAALRIEAIGFHALCQGLASSELGGFLAAHHPEPLEVWRDTLTAYVRGFAPEPPRRPLRRAARSEAPGRSGRSRRTTTAAGLNSR